MLNKEKNHFLEIEKELKDMITQDDDPRILYNLQTLGLKISQMIINIQADLISTEDTSIKQKLIRVQKRKPTIIYHNVAPGVRINAYNILYIDDCHRYKGYWCYYEKTDRFYTSLNGIAVCGYVTNINSALETPIKFHEFDSDLGSNVDNFYHPPELYSGSTDRRQITEKMCYIPATETPRPNQRYTYRIGDRNNISDDLNMSSNSDLRLVSDISAHWMMVGFLSAFETKKREEF